MKKPIINPICLTSVFDPLYCDFEGISETYGDTNPNDENAVKEVIRKEIIPDNTQELSKSQNKIKLTLQYALSLPPERVQWESLFGGMPAFDPPDDARLAFLWVWEEWFPGEDYHIDIYNDVDVRDNPSMLKRYGLDLPPKPE